MLTTTSFASQHPDILIDRTLAATAAGAPLVASSERNPSGEQLLTVPPGDLPIWPTHWQRVPGSPAASVDERFVAYTTSEGAIAIVHSTACPEPAPSGRLIAIVGLGGHRLSVMEAGEGRFLARWTSAALTHQVTVGSTTLAAFMEFVLNVSWGS